MLGRLGMRVPVIQAPMAGGACTTELVTTVSLSGGLGSIASAYMTTEDLQKQIVVVKQKLRGKCFAVNAFVPSPVNYDKGNEGVVRKYVNHLQSEIAQSKNENSPVSLPTQADIQEAYENMLAIVLNERPDVFSFTFGMPGENEMKELKQRNIFVIGWL